ncbi:hypothetical protein JCM5296_002515 [Sporobolomyces johnsonii]
MSYSTPQPPRNPNSRATQAPLTNPSLPSLSTPHRFSPYPTALRPSLFHSVPRARATALPSPSFATPSSSAAYAPPHNTPSSAFPPARNSEFGKSPHRAAHKGKHGNPFDRLSAPEFDNFVDSLTSSIRSVLAGPVVEPASVRRRREREERAREREVAQEERRRLAEERELQREREEAELEAKEEDVFGEVKRVGRLEDGIKGDEEERETEVVVIESDEEEEEEEQIENYEEDAEAEERHPSSASPPPPFFSFAQAAPVPIPERSSSPFRGRPSPHRKPLFVPDVDVDEDDAIARFEEETAGGREMSYGLNTAESAPEEEGGDYSEDEYELDEPTAQIQGRRLVDPFGRTLQYEDGSGSAEEYTLAGDAVEYEEFVEEGNDASTGREADISASVTPAPPRPKAKKAVETIELDSSSSDDGGDEGADEDELDQDEGPDAADLRLEQLLEMQLEGAVVPEHAQYSEQVDYNTDAGADADVEEADERQMVAEAQWHNAPQDGPDRMVDVLEGTFPSASASTSATEAKDEYVPQELQDELDRHMAEPEGGERMVLPYPGDEAGSAVADGAEVGEEEEFFGQGVPGDEVEMGREEPEQFDELEFEEEDGGEAKAPTYSSEESDDLGPRIPYAAKGKARVPQSPSDSGSPIQRLSSLSPSPSQSSGSGSPSASEPDEWNPALLATYTLPELSRVLAMLRGQLEQAVEADSRWIGEIQRKLEDAEGIWEAMVAEARARGEVVQEYEDEEGEEDEDSEEFVDRSAFDDEATDAQKAPPLSPEQRFVEDQLSAIASQLVDMQQQGDTGGELHVPGSALDYPGDAMVDSAQENERENAMEVDAVSEHGLTIVDEDAPLPSAAGSPALEHEVPPAVPPVAEDLESSLPPVQVVSVPPSPSAEPTPAPALSSSTTESDALPAPGEPDTGLTLVDEDAPIPSADAATPALEVPPVVPFSPTKAESSLSASPFVPTPPSTTTDLHLSSHFRVEPGPTPSLDSPLDLQPPSSTVTDVDEPVEELEVERIEPDESVAEEVPPLAETESAMEVDRVEQVDAVPAPKGEVDAGLTIVDEDAPIPSADVGSPAAVNVPPVIPFTPPVAEQLESPTPPVQVVSTAPSVEPIPGPSIEHQAVPAPAQISAPDAELTIVDEDAPIPSADAATPALEVPPVVPFSPTSAEPSLSASPFVPAPPSTTTGPHLSSHFRVEPGPVPSIDSPLNLPPPSATVTDVDEPIEELEYETEDQINELHPLAEMQDVSRAERRGEASDFERPQSAEEGLMIVDDDEPTAAQPQPSATKDERPSPTSVRLGATPPPATDEVDRDGDGPPPVVNGSAPPQNFDIVPSPPVSPPRPTEAPESAILELAAPATDAAPSRTPAAEPQPAPSPAVEAAPSTAEDMIRFDEFVNDSDDEHGEEEEEDQLASSVTDEAASSLIAPSGRRRGVAVLGLPLGEDVLTSPVAVAHGSDDEGDEADAKGEEAGEVVLSSDDESDAGEAAVRRATTNGVTEEPAKEKQVPALVAPASAPIGRRSEDEMEEGEVYEDQVDENTPAAAASAAPPSPPRIKNVQEPGEWDPSQPIRFGDAAPAPPSAVTAEVEPARATTAEEPLELGADEQLASSTPAEQLEDEAEEKEGAEPAAAQAVEAEESSAPVQAVIESGLVEVEELEEGEIDEAAMVVEMEETVVVEMELADGEPVDGAVQPNEIQSVRGSSVATDVGTVGSSADIDVELVAESVADVVMAGLDASDSPRPIEVATDLLEQAVEIVDVAASTTPLPTATPVDVDALPEDRRVSTLDEAEQGELGATEPAPPEEDSQGAPPAEEDSSALEVASKAAPSEADAAPSDVNDAAPQEDVEAAVHDDQPQVHDDQPQEDVTLPELVEEQPSAKDPLAAPSGADETIVAVSPSEPAAARLPSPAPSSDPDDELLLVPPPARAAPNAPAPSSSAAAPKRKPRSSSSEPSKLGFAAPGPLTALPASTAVQPGEPSPIRRSSRLSSTAAAGPAEPAKGKRGRKSDELGGESSDAASPSPAKRTRRTGPSKLREQEVAGDEAPASPTRPPLRVHHHHHQAPAPAASTSTSTSTSATAEPPVTRSRCHFNRLRIRSKENPDSAPYLFNIPACALASPLAQETIADFSVEDLGPVPSGGPANANATAEASSTTCPATPLGGRGLVSTDAGAARLMHERHSALIPDADVESAVRRIAGNELWDEGACEVLPREREREGEGEGEGESGDGDGVAKEAEEEQEGKGKGSRGKGRKREAEEDGATTTAKPPSKGKKRK